MSVERRFDLRAFLRGYWGWGVGIGTAIGLLNFTYYYLDDVTRGVDSRILERFIEEMTASYGVAALIPLIVWLAFRFPLDRAGRIRRSPAHLLGVLVFSAAHTLWNWGMRLAIFPLAGLGPYDYGAMPVRFFMEFPSDLIIYALVLVLSYLIHQQRRAQEQRVAFSRLETRLARAQLENLRTQLHPHFLFNALNTVSSVMYEDPAAADAMLSKLSELLRRTMERELAVQEIPLEEELETLDLYLDIMRARFGERLDVSCEVGPEARRALVPALLLQPLVENALRHGAPEPPEAARIKLTARRVDDRLEVVVADNGPGFSDPVGVLQGQSVGLPNTVARLEQLYGRDGRLLLESPSEGGGRVCVELPFRQDWLRVSDGERHGPNTPAGGEPVVLEL